MPKIKGRTSAVMRDIIYFLIATVALGVLSLWLLPDALAQEPAHSMTAQAQLEAVNNVRASLVAFLVAAGAAGTLLFTARTYLLNREGHVTDRYTKAVGQLGDASSPVRIGGVYALERIGNDSPRDRTTIIYVLGAFVRERSKEVRARLEDPQEDVKAGLRVIGRLLPTSDVILDLRDADLQNTDLSLLPAGRVLLDGAKLDGATLPEAAN